MVCKDAIAILSEKLRQHAIKNGFQIDSSYRNTNGIRLQISVMEYLYTNGFSGLKKPTFPKVFLDAGTLYQTDRNTYKKLLREANEMEGSPIDIQEKYFEWLSTQVSGTRLSMLYTLYPIIDEFCLEHHILRQPLFQTTDLSTLLQVRNTVDKNKTFHFHHKGKLSALSSAIHLYVEYIKNHQEVASFDRISSETDSSTAKQENESSVYTVAEVSDKPKKEEVEKVTLDLSMKRNYEFKSPISFTYFEEVILTSSWVSIYTESCKLLLDDYPHVFQKLIGRSITGENKVDIADYHTSIWLKKPQQISSTLFLETDWSDTALMDRLHHLITYCNVDFENIKITYTEKNDPLPLVKSEQETPSSEVSPPSPLPLESHDFHKDRVEFIDWLKKKGLSTSVIFGYISSITQCSKSAQKLGLENRNLLTISDANTLNTIKLKLFSNRSFKALAGKNYDNLMVAFLTLFSFRSATAISTSYPTKEERVLSTNASIENESETFPPSIYQKTAEIEMVDTTVPPETSVSEQKKRYLFILTTYFAEDGYQVGRAIFRGRFKKYYEREFHERPPEDDAKIDDVMTEVGTLLDGRIFPKPDNEQNSLLDTIIADILSAFADNATGIYINAVFEKYRQQLADILQIYHSDTLLSLLLSGANGRYQQKANYFSINGKIADSSTDLLRVMKTFTEPQNYDSIHKRLWYLPFDKMKTLLSRAENIVNVANGTYFYAPNLPISTQELQSLVLSIQRELSYKNYISDVELRNLLQQNCPGAAIDTASYTTFGLRNCLGYLLKEHFSFRGSIISSLGNELKIADVYADFARSHERLTLDDLTAFSDEMKANIYWDSILNEMVRISQTELIRKDGIFFDVEAIDEILETMCSGNYMSLKEIKRFLSFPNIGYPWNSFILESYLFRYSRKFKLIHSSFGNTNACGAMVRCDTTIMDYHDLVTDVLIDSEALHSTTSALNYLVSQGYQQRRSLKDIDQLIQKAKRLKEHKEEK